MKTERPCPACNSDMIEAHATHFGDSYWYCRTCKKELAEMPLVAGSPCGIRLNCLHGCGISRAAPHPDCLRHAKVGEVWLEIDLD